MAHCTLYERKIPENFGHLNNRLVSRYGSLEVKEFEDQKMQVKLEVIE